MLLSGEQLVLATLFGQRFLIFYSTRGFEMAQVVITSRPARQITSKPTPNTNKGGKPSKAPEYVWHQLHPHLMLMSHLALRLTSSTSRQSSMFTLRHVHFLHLTNLHLQASQEGP